MVLPAANNERREIGESRRIEGDLQEDPKVLLVHLLEREVDYQKKLNELRDELAAIKDFSVSELYEKLAVGQYGVILTSLNRFLSVNGFFAMQTDTDAILRRFDHNANQSLDYSEFHELVTG